MSRLSRAPAASDVIDVDELETGTSRPIRRTIVSTPQPINPVRLEEDADVVFEGFQSLRTEIPGYKQEELDRDGLAYTGFSIRNGKHKRGQQGERAAHNPPKQSASMAGPSRGNSAGASSKEPIIISDSDEDEGAPPSKRAKVDSSRLIPRPGTKSPCRRTRRKNTPEPEPRPQSNAARCDEEDAQDCWTSGLDIDNRENWQALPGKMEGVHLYGDDADNDEDLALRLQLAAMSFDEGVSVRLRDRSASLQSQSTVFDWSENSRTVSTRTHHFSMLQEAIPPSICQQKCIIARPIQHYTTFNPTSWKLQDMKVIYKAPGDINTIVQNANIVVIASAVTDGASYDVPGPYNREGSLGFWDRHQCWALEEDGHQKRVTRPSRVYEPWHHLTVNDVAIDPNHPFCFTSTGRDNRVLQWVFDPLAVEQPTHKHPKQRVRHAVLCDDNPEVVKYRPGSSTLAIQCDNGAVYILHDDELSDPLRVAPAGRGHVTADIHWGVESTEGRLFASSACTASGSGYHKLFDVERGTAVMEFNADGHACSTLTLDPLGQTLYIATEGPELPYILRRYDTRKKSPRNRNADQQIAMEPFAGTPDRSETDINGLSISSDGVYIAAARTDNWLDVYDARMLSRGPLYKFAHEVAGGPDSYGVVKTQWVEGRPFGTGFVSGGLDGCVRLWDITLSSEDPRNGEPLAQCENYVATFTLGDMFAGESPIVVGEGSGKVTAFDFGTRE